MGEAQAIREALVQAGVTAMEHFRHVTPRWKESRSYVTEADLAVQASLVAWLRARYPRDGIIAEEDGCRVKPQGSGRVWTLDPIDGTASFVAGLPLWGLGLGMMVGAQARAGYFYIPMTGDFYACVPGVGVRRNGQKAGLKDPAPLHRESVLLSISRTHQAVHVHDAYPGKIRSLGSTIGHMCFVATGSADAALLGRVWIWDLLPGWALLKAAGGVLKYLHGPRVDLSALRDGSRAKGLMLCGHPEAVRRYEKLLRAA